jgi:N-methylhydantoinase A
MPLIGIDTGGTFTDFVVWEPGGVRVHKVLSTPDAPERAILAGIADLGLSPGDLRLVHGSTVATNAVLEGKGARTLYVANRGFEDLLGIARQARPDLYDLQPATRPPPVPSDLCVGTGGRLAADGSTLEPLTPQDLEALQAAVARLAPEAVAVNLLFAYLDDAGERTIASALAQAAFVSRSSEVLPVAGEYERGIATWLNASLGPVISRYLGRLCSGLPGARIAVMQSSGEAISADQTARHAARLLLSGPAGGLAGAAFVSSAVGERRLLTFDMGGTSTDVAVIDGEIQLATQGRVAGFPVHLPMIDMHTIGAGGGSIVRVDAGGMLLVGPESAGADPGPACYGRGGKLPTVTDANLVLGRLDPDGFLGGAMRLDADAARRALGPVATALGLSVESAALGVVRLADEHMARALRTISVERGLDPRGFVLTAFGGAGGLHACSLAESLGISSVLVPVHAGVLSALGMLAAPPGRTLARAWPGTLAESAHDDIAAALETLAQQGIDALEAEGREASELRVDRSLDLRYRGQSSTLEVPWVPGVDPGEAFGRLHVGSYGHTLDLPVELVNLRVRVRARPAAITLGEKKPAPPEGGPMRRLRSHGCRDPVPVWTREDVPATGITGPAIVADSVATLWVAPGWTTRLDRVGNLRLDRP